MKTFPGNLYFRGFTGPSPSLYEIFMREGAYEIRGEAFASPRQTLLTGCETRIDNPHAVSTGGVDDAESGTARERAQRRLRTLLRPSAVDKTCSRGKKSRDELRSFDSELEHRHVTSPDVTADIGG